ncbi:PHB depolymerase family esterase [Lacimicrobium sp. SS2-24]|uniref:extracellular catalytic domain type 2 short-chain-length polyhydroxyalkanoate depolymerase n=1 Tax=Lacimicrobium sp. SS2-24 TaxID=2005569 RepID=UPI000B4BB648|nr:PHB depolymerase family esterase [Lacimicrobium sp. SS2-24]
MKHLLMAATLGLSAQAMAQLPQLKLDIDAITVSGLSSGGYMATQFHVAHSDWVSGAGIIAAGPYYCARNSIMTALSECVNKQDKPVDLSQIETTLKDWESQKLISDLEHLKGDKVWILHGSEDKKVIVPVTEQLVSQYQRWAGTESVQYINDKPFAHHFPTLDNGTACEVSEAPFIGNCDYDAAAEMLGHISDAEPVSVTAEGQLFSINQQELGGDAASGLADMAYVYAPSSCINGATCQVHVSFHGCNQNIEAVGNDYARLTGINNWADEHNTVVLYPQTQKSNIMPLNPQACWDWWGYTDEHYATQKGQQIMAVTNMVHRLAGE